MPPLAPAATPQGLGSTRHLEALYSAPKYFSEHQVRHTNLPSGATVAYTLHGTYNHNNDAEASRSLPEVEDRVVLITGFLQTKDTWAAVIDLLLDHYNVKKEDEVEPTKARGVRILSFDNRGVGGSSVPAYWTRSTTKGMAKDVLALMDVVDWDSAHIVGYSMGGMISLELASIAPKRIKSLSLLATTRGKYIEDPRSREPLRQSVYAKDPSVAVANLLELLYPRDAITETRVDETGETQYDTLFKFHMESRKSQAIQPSAWAMVSQLLAIRTHFVSNARLLAINDCGFPVLIVTGMKDILIPPAESICLREHMTGDHVHTLFIENAGHGVTLQFVAEVVQALAATFQRNSC